MVRISLQMNSPNLMPSVVGLSLSYVNHSPHLRRGIKLLSNEFSTAARGVKTAPFEMGWGLHLAYIMLCLVPKTHKKPKAANGKPYPLA